MRQAGAGLPTGPEAGLNRVERFMFRRLPKALAKVPPSLRRLVEHSIRHEAEELLTLDDSATARSIDHLSELAGETGTYSILDVTHLAARPEFAAAAPMLASDLRSTNRPKMPPSTSGKNCSGRRTTSRSQKRTPIVVRVHRIVGRLKPEE
jgi:hypothetical protein